MKCVNVRMKKWRNWFELIYNSLEIKNLKNLNSRNNENIEINDNVIEVLHKTLSQINLICLLIEILTMHF
jgi:hypothetical protein